MVVEGVLVGGRLGGMGQEGRRLSLQHWMAEGEGGGVGAAQGAYAGGPHLWHNSEGQVR